MELKNKIFAVSGAGSGLGNAIAQKLCDEGARVIALDVRFDQKVQASWNDKHVFIQKCDVRSPDEVAKAIENGVSHFGSLHGGIACAGIAPAQKIHSSRKGSHSFDDFTNTLAVNLTGTFNLFNSCVPYLKNNPLEEDHERGVLLATSSIAATEGQIGQVAYAASKGGVSAMILPLARELGKSGIRVNAIAPGIFETPMVAAFPDEVLESLAEAIPFPQRLGKPEEFAELATHIINNQYINGSVMRLDGSVRMG